MNVNRESGVDMVRRLLEWLGLYTAPQSIEDIQTLKEAKVLLEEMRQRELAQIRLIDQLQTKLQRLQAVSKLYIELFEGEE